MVCLVAVDAKPDTALIRAHHTADNGQRLVGRTVVDDNTLHLQVNIILGHDRLKTSADGLLMVIG